MITGARKPLRRLAPLALALLGASPALAFNDDTETGVAPIGVFSANFGGRTCMNPADAADSLARRVVCNAEFLNQLGITSSIVPGPENRTRKRAAAQIFRLCNRLRNLASSCQAISEQTEAGVLRFGQDPSRIATERSSNRALSRGNARDERGSDLVSCTFASDWEEDGGTYPGNQFDQALREQPCTDCEDLDDLIGVASSSVIVEACGNVGLCEVDGELTDFFCVDAADCAEEFAGVVECLFEFD